MTGPAVSVAAAGPWMCEAVGFPVQRLVRVRIGPLRDSSLGPGEFRRLTMEEVRDLVEAVAGAPRSYDRRP